MAYVTFKLLTNSISFLHKTNRFHVTVRLFRSQKTPNVVRASVTHLPRGQYSVVALALWIDSENNGPKQTYKRNNGTSGGSTP